MKKLVVSIIAFLAMTGSGYAGDFDGDYGVDLGASVSTQGLTISRDHDSDLRVEYLRGIPGFTAGGSLFYDRRDTNANVVGIGFRANRELGEGVEGGIGFGKVSLGTDFGWDWTNSDLFTETELKYTLAGVGAYTTQFLDIDDFKYDGMDLGLDYTLALSDNVSVVPSVEIPYDGDFNRLDAKAHIYFKVSF